MDLRPVEDPELNRRPLDAEALRKAVLGGDGSFWRAVDVVAETGSTNADLSNRAAAGADIAGTVLIAEAQTAGRGRNGRSWSTVPYAQLTLSVGIDALGTPSDRWGWVPLAAGVSVVDAVRSVGSVEAGVKWPNDVLAGPEQRKLAGILAEVVAPRPVIVLGLGINVTLRPDEVGEPTVASLASLGSTSLDRTELASRVLVELDRRIEQWRGGDAVLAEDYRARSLTIGTVVRAELPGPRTIVGEAVAVDPDGRLAIDTGIEVATVSAGDVTHLRRP